MCSSRWRACSAACATGSRSGVNPPWWASRCRGPGWPTSGANGPSRLTSGFNASKQPCAPTAPCPRAAGILIPGTWKCAADRSVRRACSPPWSITGTAGNCCGFVPGLAVRRRRSRWGWPLPPCRWARPTTGPGMLALPWALWHCWSRPARSTSARPPLLHFWPPPERSSGRRNAMNGDKGRSIQWRLLRQARPYGLQLAGIFLLSLLSTPFALLTPLPLKIAVDSVLAHRPLPRFLHAWLGDGLTQSPGALLALAVGLLVGVAVLTQLRDFANAFLTAYTGEKLLRSFRAQLFRHVQRLSFSYHDSKGTADSTYRIQYDAAAVQNIVVEGVVPFITAAVTFLSMIYVTARINWQLAIVALAVSPAIFLVSRIYRRRLRGQAREVKKIESSALAVVHEVLGAARVVKAFGQEDREENRFVHKSNEGMRARMRLVFSEGGYGLLVALITAVGMAAVMFIGVRAIESGALALGSFMLVWGYIAQLYGPLKTISKKAASLQNNLAGAERAFALLDEVPEVAERANARPLARARGAMVFRNVAFAYEHNQPVLQNISFEIRPGTCLGITGTTGAGKTTLVNLLTRVYDPTAGQILLDGADLRDYKLADLRNQFAIVLQEPVLFSTSIAENIAYARPDAIEQEIVAAAKAANVHDRSEEHTSELQSRVDIS